MRLLHALQGTQDQPIPWEEGLLLWHESFIEFWIWGVRELSHLHLPKHPHFDS